MSNVRGLGVLQVILRRVETRSESRNDERRLDGRGMLGNDGERRDALDGAAWRRRA